MDISSLLSQVLDSRIATLMLQDMSTPRTEDRSAPGSTRWAFDSRMESDARQFAQSSQNMRDAVGMVEVAQSGVTSIKHQLSEMHSIVAEMAGVTEMSAEQYAAYSSSLAQQAQVIAQTANGIEFNGMKLLNGTAGMNGDGTVVLQAGGDSMDQVFTNLMNNGLGTDVLSTTDGSMNLSALEAQTNITSQAEAETFLANLQTYMERLGGIEADYSYDIKALDSLSVLFDNRADIFENTIQYRSDGNGSETASNDEISSYLSEILMGNVNGNIFSGNG